MSQVYVLYNPLSGNQGGKSSVECLNGFFKGKTVTYQDITAVKDYQALLSGLSAGDALVLCGGDGTLNCFINNIYDLNVKQPLFYYPTGSGNDFLRDLGKTVEEGPVQINDYIKDLPCVEVKGKTYRFINGVGYGIDGYCCEVGEQLRKEGKKPDYTGIAIKGLLFHYQATNAHVTVDGKEYDYKRVWIAPTMHGRYYGGGMMPAPGQDRNDPEHKLSVMVMHKAGRIGTLCVFPSIFKGKHINHKKSVALHAGHDITVRFDKPVTLQIDGEVITDVSEYRARSRALAAVK